MSEPRYHHGPYAACGSEFLLDAPSMLRVIEAACPEVSEALLQVSTGPVKQVRCCCARMRTYRRGEDRAESPTHVQHRSGAWKSLSARINWPKTALIMDSIGPFSGRSHFVSHSKLISMQRLLVPMAFAATLRPVTGGAVRRKAGARTDNIHRRKQVALRERPFPFQASISG